MKKNYLLTLIAFLLFHMIPAQRFQPMELTRGDEEINLGTLQEAFYEWSKKQDPTTIKANKPFHRWMWFNQMRQPADESMNVAWNYYKAAEKISNLKHDQKSFSLNGWIPVGPMDLVPSTSNAPIHDIGRLNCIAFHPDDPNVFWVAAPQGGVWKTSDGGQNWMPLGDELPVMRVSDIAVDPNNPDVMYICLGDYGYLMLFQYNAGRPTHYGLGVYKSSDGGLNWEPTGLTFMIEDGYEGLMRRVFINPDDPSELLAAGVSGIYKSNDGGVTWDIKSERFIWDIEQQPGRYSTLYATSYQNSHGGCGIHKSDDFGETWQLLNTGIPQYNAVLRIEVAVAPSDSNYVYSACSGYDDAFYGFYKSTDAGQSWTKTADSSEVNIFGQTNGAPDNKLAQASYDMWVMVDKDDPELVFTGGMNIWGSPDGGETWDPCSFGFDYFGESIHFDHHFVKQNPLDEQIYFCSDGGLFRTDELVLGDRHLFDSCWTGNHLTPDCFQFETQWENLSSGLMITEFYRLGLSYNNPGYLIAGSQDNCVFKKDPADDWINLTQGDGMEGMIDANNPEILYASNQFGVLYKSYNGGQNMTPNPITINILLQEGLGVWVTPFQMDQQQPEIVFAGFWNVWRSAAGGSGWYKISNFSNMPGYGQPKPIWDMAIAPSNSDVMYISKQPYPLAGLGLSGEIWRTVDGGDNWDNITNGLPSLNTYINDIAVTEDPDRAYIVCSGFVDAEKVFMTANGGQSWENISGMIPNIAVTSIVYQIGSPLNDLYVGSDMGVFFRNDNYDDWILYSDDLPNVIVNELEISYPENKLYAATYGRGIWQADLMNPVTGFDESGSFIRQLEAGVSPNPCTENFQLTVSGEVPGEIEFELIDILGNRVLHADFALTNNQANRIVDVSNLTPGLYFVRIYSGNQSKVCRLVKN
nr:T9SS type A sorting domain-containing protein [Bacteroidota bacterium]